MSHSCLSRQRTVAELTPAEVARFWSKVHTSDTACCWLWTNRTNNRGYGRFETWRGGRRQRFLAHRVAYQLTNGQALGEAVLLHSCDTPACCNPHHLRPGTQADNIADARAKGRMMPPPTGRGEDSPHARLTQAKAQEIRQRYAQGGISYRQLGAEYGVHPTAIGLVIRGRTWGPQ